MKKVLLSLLLTFLVAISPAYSQSPTIIEAAHRATVKIEASTTSATGVYLCTGVKIGIIRILTAAHCVPSNTTDIHINGMPGARIVRRTADSGPIDGLLLLEVPPQPGPLLKIAEQEPRPGEEATTLGFVDRVGTRVAFRRWVAGYGMAEASKLVGIDGFLAGGMSGGPIINSKGELIGINQAIAPPGVGLATRLKVIKEFLK